MAARHQQPLLLEISFCRVARSDMLALLLGGSERRNQNLPDEAVTSYLWPPLQEDCTRATSRRRRVVLYGVRSRQAGSANPAGGGGKILDSCGPVFAVFAEPRAASRDLNEFNLSLSRKDACEIVC